MLASLGSVARKQRHHHDGDPNDFGLHDLNLQAKMF